MDLDKNHVPNLTEKTNLIADSRFYSYYAYDHRGERRLKLTGDNKLLDVNANFMATYTILNEQTLYPSAYMVLTLSLGLYGADQQGIHQTLLCRGGAGGRTARRRRLECHG